MFFKRALKFFLVTDKLLKLTHSLVSVLQQYFIVCDARFVSVCACLNISVSYCASSFIS